MPAPPGSQILTNDEAQPQTGPRELLSSSLLHALLPSIFFHFPISSSFSSPLLFPFLSYPLFSALLSHFSPLLLTLSYSMFSALLSSPLSSPISLSHPPLSALVYSLLSSPRFLSYSVLGSSLVFSLLYPLPYPILFSQLSSLLHSPLPHFISCPLCSLLLSSSPSLVSSHPLFSYPLLSTVFSAPLPINCTATASKRNSNMLAHT